MPTASPVTDAARGAPAAAPRGARPWQLLAAGAPVLFTGAWWALGSATPGSSQLDDTISAVAAVGAPRAGLMVAAFLVQGLGQLAGARLALAAPRAGWVAAMLAVGGIGTLLAGAVRLPGDGGPAWASAGHALAATAAFAGLHLAVLAGALSRSVPRRLRVAAVAALVVALPHLAWFLAHLGSGDAAAGYAEKVFTTVLLVWCAALALLRWSG